MVLKLKRSSTNMGVVTGGGGGAGYRGGIGAGSTLNGAGAGTSFLNGSLSGQCTDLAGNSGNGYVTVTPQ